jgi:branched-subunit amino acid aminotransferase/4-amino-4-deoxychorismate lyase
LHAVQYQRPTAHLKHLATEQRFHSRAALQAGYNDALLTAPDGAVSETAIANIGFFDDTGIVWPDAPLLRGITMQLLDSQLASRPARIRLQDAPSLQGAFVSNSRGIAAVTEIDGVVLPRSEKRVGELIAAYDAVPWDAI